MSIHVQCNLIVSLLPVAMCPQRAKEKWLEEATKLEDARKKLQEPTEVSCAETNSALFNNAAASGNGSALLNCSRYTLSRPTPTLYQVFCNCTCRMLCLGDRISVCKE